MLGVPTQHKAMRSRTGAPSAMLKADQLFPTPRPAGARAPWASCAGRQRSRPFRSAKTRRVISEGTAAQVQGKVMNKSETAWEGFPPGRWQQAIDVRDFIVRN